MNNLEDIKDRLAAATPGPWEAYLVGLPSRPIEEKEWIVDSAPTFICSTQIWTDRGNADAEFIAHAPEDIARLVKALESVTERLDKMHMEAHAMTCEVDEKRRAVGLRLWREVKKLRKAITEALDS